MSCLLESFLGSLLFWLPSLSLISLAVMFRFSPTSGLSDGLGEVLELEEGLTEELTEELDWRLGCLWTGVTSGWLGNFPNPIEIAGAVDDCLSKAHEQGLHGNVYMGGHSLGGIMLETWIEDNPDRAEGDS